MADAQDLLLRRQVRHVVVEGADVCGDLRDLREIGQVVIVLVPGVELRVGLGVAGEVARVVVEGTDVCRDNGDAGGVRQVVVVAAETVARLVGVQREGHAQQLLRGPYRVVGAAVKVNSHIDKKHSAFPVDLVEIAVKRIAFTDIQRYQAVGIGECPMPFPVCDMVPALRVIFHDKHLHPHLSVGYQLVIGVPHHGLVGEFFRCLREKGGRAEHKDCKKGS